LFGGAPGAQEPAFFKGEKVAVRIRTVIPPAACLGALVCTSLTAANVARAGSPELQVRPAIPAILASDSTSHSASPAFGAPMLGASDTADIHWASGFDLADVNGYVFTQIVFNGRLIVAGQFSLAGGCPSRNIASWDGVSWDSLGPGLEYGVLAMTVYDDRLFASGFITSPYTGLSEGYVAWWDGTAWVPLLTRMNGVVRTLAVYDGQLFAGGEFTTSAAFNFSYLAAWDGTSWSSLATGVNAPVLTMTVLDSSLIVGGVFTTAGGLGANRIAAWDGRAWRPLG